MTTTQQTSSDFSDYRLKADTAARGHDTNVSMENLRALIKNDPYDGRAQHELALTLFFQVVEAQDAIEETNRSELPDRIKSSSWSRQNRQPPPDDQSVSASPSATDAQAARDREANVDALIDQAIKEYKLAAKHPRYRTRSQIQQAVLLASKGDYNAALDNLENFVNNGGATRRGLDQIEQFGSSMYRNKPPTKLHAYPKFWLILALERINRHGNGGRPSIDWFPTLNQQDTGIWNFLKRLNHDLIPYRIKLVDLISKRFK